MTPLGWLGRKTSTQTTQTKHNSRPEVIKKISCSIQLSMKFSLLINMKRPTIFGIFIFIAEKCSCSAVFSKKEFAVVSNLRFISRTKFHAQLNWAWKKFYNLGAWYYDMEVIIEHPVKSYESSLFMYKLWTKILEIRQNFNGDRTKFYEIFLNITLELPQYSLKSFFMSEACENYNSVWFMFISL